MINQIGLTTIANLAHAFTQWLLLVITVKYFDQLVLGQLMMCLSITAPLFLLFSFKLRSLVVTDYHNTYSFEQYLCSRFLAQIFVIICILVLIPFVMSELLPSIILSVILFKVSDGICELNYSYLHKHQAFSIVAKSQLLRSFCTISALMGAAYFTSSVSVTFIIWALTTFFFAIFDTFKAGKILVKTEQRRFQLLLSALNLKTHINSIKIYKQYWPVGLSILFGAMFMYIPNYVLAYYYDHESVGKFSAISYFIVAGGILINSLSQAATPKLSNLFHKHRYSEFIDLTKLLMLSGATIGVISFIIVYLAGTWILQLVYNSAISALHIELQLVIFASIIRYSYIFLGSALNVLKCFNQQSIVFGCGAATLAISCLILVPIHGTIGAAMSMILACLIEFVIMARLFITQWRKVKVPA